MQNLLKRWRQRLHPDRNFLAALSVCRPQALHLIGPGDGDWFTSLTVQVRQAGNWANASSLNSTPACPGVNNGTGYETYSLQFAPVTGDAIWLYAVPGGSTAFISAGELQVPGP